MRSLDKILLTSIILITAGLALRELDYLHRARKVRPPLTVYLLGHVANPGAVTLPQGSRRLHAVARCGGVLPGADLLSLGPAEHLRDGETIIVQELSPKLPLDDHRAVSTDILKKPQPSAINLNQATAGQLQEVPGIGPVLAQRIVEARQRRPQGTFTSLEDLTGIRGIKRKTLARFKPYLELEGI